MQRLLLDSPKNSTGSTPISKRTRSRKLFVSDSPKITKYLLKDLNQDDKNKKRPGINDKNKKQLPIVQNKVVKRKQKNTSNPKISNWLKPKVTEDNNKYPALNIETGKDNNNVIISSESDDSPLKLKTLTKSKAKPRDSYGKYGIFLPSFSDIVQERDNLQTYSKKIDEICDIRNTVDIENVVEKIKTPKKLPVLGCEHLPLKEIDRYFKMYRDYCNGIMEGRIASKRHDKYLNQVHEDLSMNGLTYNTSMVTFSHEQKQRLAKLCNRYFAEKKGIENLTQYYFQVMLPELCLKIFMDVHSLSKSEAIEYLDKRPVEDIK